MNEFGLRCLQARERRAIRHFFMAQQAHLDGFLKRLCCCPTQKCLETAWTMAAHNFEPCRGHYEKVEGVAKALNYHPSGGTFQMV